MFMKLFGYISGANVGENEIKMTVPVSMKMRGNKNSFEKEMCFYLDNKHQGNPPQPTNRDVYIVNRPAMNVYTRFVNVHLSYLNHYLPSSYIRLFLTREMIYFPGGKADI